MTLYIISGIIGFLLGLAYCYWTQIKKAYDNRDKISAGLTFVSAGVDFYEKL